MKKHTIPKAVREKNKYTLKYDNTVIANVSLDVLTFVNEDKISTKMADFYGRFVSNFVRWSENDFYKYAQNEYSFDENPRKKYRFVPLKLKLEMSNEQTDENTYKVCITITMTKNKTASKVETFHVWNIQNGTLRIRKVKKDG